MGFGFGEVKVRRIGLGYGGKGFYQILQGEL